MKKLILTFTVLLTGCSFLHFNYTKYEYHTLIAIETNVRLLNEYCDDNDFVIERLNTLNEQTELLKTFSQYKPSHSETIQLSQIINTEIKEFKSAYDKNNGSPVYCKLKSRVLLIKMQNINQTISTKEML